MTDVAPRNLPAPAPIVNVETKRFWDATTEGKLVLPRCTACGLVIWYPRAFCPFCSSTSVSDVEVGGGGTVYTFTVVRKGSGPFRDRAPYVLAVVELDEGPRMMTNVINVDPAELAIGDRVQVVFDPVLDDTGARVGAVPRFEPAR